MKASKLDLSKLPTGDIKGTKVISSSTNEVYQKIFKIADNPQRCTSCIHCEFQGSYDYNGEPLYGGGKYLCTKKLNGNSSSSMYQSVLCKERGGYESSASESNNLQTTSSNSPKTSNHTLVK